MTGVGFGGCGEEFSERFSVIVGVGAIGGNGLPAQLQAAPALDGTAIGGDDVGLGIDQTTGVRGGRGDPGEDFWGHSVAASGFVELAFGEFYIAVAVDVFGDRRYGADGTKGPGLGESGSELWSEGEMVVEDEVIGDVADGTEDKGGGDPGYGASNGRMNQPPGRGCGVDGLAEALEDAVLESWDGTGIVEELSDREIHVPSLLKLCGAMGAVGDVRFELVEFVSKEAARDVGGEFLEDFVMFEHLGVHWMTSSRDRARF